MSWQAQRPGGARIVMCGARPPLSVGMIVVPREVRVDAGDSCYPHLEDRGPRPRGGGLTIGSLEA